eukprot:augustus_masked-scaffold_42-processed-gene-0.37-mRNA-1 protein AED:0.44 eAED:0.44 QI:0/-1/0/1/-1/1/1/0/475
MKVQFKSMDQTVNVHSRGHITMILTFVEKLVIFDKKLSVVLKTPSDVASFRDRQDAVENSALVAVDYQKVFPHLPSASVNLEVTTYKNRERLESKLLVFCNGLPCTLNVEQMKKMQRMLKVLCLDLRADVHSKHISFIAVCKVQTNGAGVVHFMSSTNELEVDPGWGNQVLVGVKTACQEIREKANCKRLAKIRPKIKKRKMQQSFRSSGVRALKFGEPKINSPSIQRADNNGKKAAQVEHIDQIGCFAHSNEAKLSLEKGDLIAVNLVGQFSKKFLVCKLVKDEETRLLVFDQHAVDERAHLEQYLELWEHGHWKTNFFESIALNKSFGTSLSERFLFQKMKRRMASIGIKINTRTARPLSDCCVTLERTIRIFNRPLDSKQILLSLARHLENNNVDNSQCEVVLEILKSVACRNSVMFGTEISFEKAAKLLKELQSCKFPFQCAHGRPNVFPFALKRKRKLQEPRFQYLHFLK